MEKTDRKTRMAAAAALLTRNPGRTFSLKVFCDMFGAAKSTMSEDLSMLRTVFHEFGQGDIEVILGAGGGVRYIPALSAAQKDEALRDIAERLSDPSRILPGGFVYTADIFSNTRFVAPMAEVLAGMYYRTNPDVIVTVETKGVPLALLIAHAMAKPLVVARRDVKITEGSVVTFNYLSANSSRMRTMSMSRRAVSPGQKALLIDDFIAGGGTVYALCEMMKEFAVTVVGCGVAIATRQPEKKQAENYRALFTLEEVDTAAGRISIHPA